MRRYRSQIREAMDRIVVTLALEQGFNAYLPVYEGALVPGRQNPPGP